MKLFTPERYAAKRQKHMRAPQDLGRAHERMVIYPWYNEIVAEQLTSYGHFIDSWAGIYGQVKEVPVQINERFIVDSFEKRFVHSENFVKSSKIGSLGEISLIDVDTVLIKPWTYQEYVPYVGKLLVASFNPYLEANTSGVESVSSPSFVAICTSDNFSKSSPFRLKITPIYPSN